MTDLPPVAAPFQLPFHYGALHQVGVDYLVDPEPARTLLAEAHPALSVAEFDGLACVSLNFQLYFAQYAEGAGVTQEIEINIVSYPSAHRKRLPDLSHADYLRGVDQTKLLGIGRIHVLCDNDIAIEAGTKLFAEPKHPARFSVTTPSPNGPLAHTWRVACQDADAELFSFTVRLDGLVGEPVSNAPITGYGTTADGRLLAGPMNVYHPYQAYTLDDADRVDLRITAPQSAVGKDLDALIGDTPAACAWTLQSPPVAAHHRPYYVD
jgi:hypothetical protein